ncbi:MAG TPA: hypothetical protein VKE40_23995 [Gemmataceae bacterium]|nr:hypothetical protein [Gemmataceae bacterium]
MRTVVIVVLALAALGSIRVFADEPKPAEVKLAKLDLAAAGLPLTVDAPEGAKAEDFYGAVKVTKGDAFGFYVMNEGKDLADLKKKFLANDSLKDKKVIKESSDELVYEFIISGFDVKVYYFHLNVKAGGKEYCISNQRSHINSTQNKQSVELAMKCAKTLAAKSK